MTSNQVRDRGVHTHVFYVLFNGNQLPKALVILHKTHDTIDLVETDALSGSHEISFDFLFPRLALFMRNFL